MTDNVFQDKVGHENYGTYIALFSFCSLFSVFYDLGLSHFSARNIAQDNKLFKKLFNPLFMARTLAVIVFPLIITLCGYLIGYRGRELTWLYILSLSANLFHFETLLRAKLQAFHFFKLDSVASVAQKLLLIFGVLLLLYYGISVKNYLIVELITHLLVFGVLYVLIVKLFGRVKLKFEFKEIASTVYKALPFAVMTLLYSFNAKIDIVMLERMTLDGAEAGLYYGAVRLFDAVMMYPWIIMPMFFAKFAAYGNDKEQAANLLRIGTILMFVPILMVACIFMFEPGPLLALHQNSTDAELNKMMLILSILAITLLIHGFSVVMGTYLNASGYVKNVNAFVGVSVIVNMSINWIYIPQYGAYAAAWSTVFSLIVLMIAYFYLGSVKAKIKINYLLMGKLLVMATALFACMYYVSSFKWMWLFNWMSIGIITGFLVLILGLWNKDLYKLEE